MRQERLIFHMHVVESKCSFFLVVLQLAQYSVIYNKIQRPLIHQITGTHADRSTYLQQKQRQKNNP